MRPSIPVPVLVGLLVGLSGSLRLQAQEPESAFRIPTTNPHAVVLQQIAGTEVEIDYHRPRVRNRTIFGGLVPYGQVWRTGSDNATRIRFSTPVSVGGKRLGAGTYELFSIPGETEWTIIFQEVQAQWGSYSYDDSKDALRVSARPEALAGAVESFTLALDDVQRASATLALTWDRVRVPLTLTVDVRETVVPQLEELLLTAERKPYFLAAMFYFEHDLDMERAAELMEAALAQNPGHIGMLHRQALILEKKGDIEGAIAAAERSLAGAATSPPELREEYTRLNTALLERLRGPRSR
ncbi:MAG: DUF2911 domain-containing protein [Gemmatimonadota bacterium]